ncbi:hypothetical protein CR513_41833, partial [Mucuna pruriens]
MLIREKRLRVFKQDMPQEFNGTQDSNLRTIFFQERKPNKNTRIVEVEPQGGMNFMETKALQGPMTKGRMRRLQDEVLKEISLPMGQRNSNRSPTIYSLWDCTSLFGFHLRLKPKNLRLA